MDTVKSGTFTGDATAKNIEIGYIPRNVEVVNVTDGIVHVWQRGGHADGTATRVDTGAVVASNGISAYNGVPASNSYGFTIGTGLNLTGKVLSWKATRDLIDPGNPAT